MSADIRPLPQRPSALIPQAEKMPAELRARDQWVCWGWEYRPEQSKPWTKPPVDAFSSRAASTTAPDTWNSHAMAVARYTTQLGAGRKLDGIGYVLTAADGIVGVDLDHCRNPETGKLEPWAEKIVGRLNSYTEVTPSGTGLRIFVRGTLPPGGRKRGDVEIYSGERFLTVTGHHLTGTPVTIEDRAEEILELHREWFGDEPGPSAATAWTPAPGPLLPQDEALIERLRAKDARFDFLWAGTWEGVLGTDGKPYPSRSEADLALCSILANAGADRVQVDRIFRHSGLMREKWDRGAGRRTVNRAFRDLTLPPISGGGGNQAEPSSPPETGPEDNSPESGATDYALACELAKKYGADFRYCSDQQVWFVWDGTRWIQGSEDKIVPYVIQLAKERYRRASLSNDSDKRQRLAKEAKRLETTSAVHQIVAMAQTLPALRTETSEYNHDAFLLNVANGTIDLKTGALRSHRRGDKLTRLIPVEYDPAARAPVFEHFIRTIFGGNAGLIGFLQRALGYSLTGSVREQCFFLCWGSGSNGKSTLFNLMLQLFGDYGAKMAASTLLASRGRAEASAMNDMATLQGARFVATIESDMGRRLNEAQVKELTGGDRIKVKRLYKDVFSIDPTWKVWAATNHRPIIRGRDLAMWRRVRLIPFEVTFSEDEQDKELPERLQVEFPGILRWLVEGCLAWQREGLEPPKEVREAIARYHSDMDDLGDFLAERCVADPKAWVSMTSLYSVYSEWAREGGEFVWSKRSFGDRLDEAGFRAKRSVDKTSRGRAGLRLRLPTEPIPDPPERGSGGRIVQGDASEGGFAQTFSSTSSRGEFCEKDASMRPPTLCVPPNYGADTIVTPPREGWGRWPSDRVREATETEVAELEALLTRLYTPEQAAQDAQTALEAGDWPGLGQGEEA